MRVWAEHEHPYNCDCAECVAEFIRRTEGGNSERIRREAGCRLVEFSAETAGYADTYINTLRGSGGLNLLAEDCIFEDIFSVGERVRRQIERHYREKAHREAEQRGRTFTG